MAETQEKKSGFFGSLKGMFVEEVPERKTEEEHGQQAVTRNTPLPPIQRNTPLPPMPTTPVPQAVDATIKAKLEEAVLHNAPPGFMELHDTMSALSDTIPDETARFKAAMKLAVRHGHDPAALLGEVDACLGVLDSKKSEFGDVSQNQMKKTVAAREEFAAHLDDSIKEKQAMISSLQTEIADMQQQRQQALSEAAVERQHVSQLQQGFANAYEVVKRNLQDMRSKIEALKGTV